MCLRALGLFVASLSLCAFAYSSDAKVEELLAATDGPNTYFRIRLAEPPDILQAGDADRRWQQSLQPLRGPRLASNPVWETPCYPVTPGPAWDRNASTPLPLTFIGCAKSGAKPELLLTYPRAGGGWGTARVVPDLSRAGKLTESAADGGTRSRGLLTPAQQYAVAQTRWLEQLADDVDDPAGFLTYARLRLARKAGILAPRGFSSSAGFGRGTEFLSSELSYDTLTGARAIQESLQVDRALAGLASDTTAPRTVSVTDISGITVRAHPYDEMRKGRAPRVHPLAQLVPSDQYFLWFRSVAKLQELADFMQEWGETGLETADASDGARDLRQRIQAQLCLPEGLLSKALGTALVRDVAITGSDPFLREGTDITVIFEAVSPDAFRKTVDVPWDAAARDNPGAKRDSTTTGGVRVESIVSADRSVSAYRAFDGNLAFYSNSLPALERVLALRGATTGSVAASPDYRYMTAAWEPASTPEDGFLFLSDAFVRAINSPATKIGEKRRMDAYLAMRDITNAALLHGYLRGPGELPDLAGLVESGVLDSGSVDLPDAGKLRWDPATLRVSSSVYGSPGFMTPLRELAIDKVTTSEQAQYEQFRDRYQSYWRRYFDPIAVRFTVGSTMAFDVNIMPLIDESAYNDLKELTGNEASRLDLSTVSTATVARLQVHLDRDSRTMRQLRGMAEGPLGGRASLGDWIGDWAALWVEDGPRWSAISGLHVRLRNARGGFRAGQ